MGAWFKAHPKWTVSMAAVAALVVGGGIGLAATQDDERISELEDQVTTLEDEVAGANRRADRAESELADRLDSIDREEERLKDQRARQRAAAAEREKDLDAREDEISAAEQELESSKIPDGIGQSGRDFEPGLYRSPGGEGCYWAKLNSANTDDIINNGASPQTRPFRSTPHSSRQAIAASG